MDCFFTDTVVLGIGLTPPASIKNSQLKVVKNANIVLLNITSQNLDKLHSAHEVCIIESCQKSC
jgi:hypothetical protein